MPYLWLLAEPQIITAIPDDSLGDFHVSWPTLE